MKKVHIVLLVTILFLSSCISINENNQSQLEVPVEELVSSGTINQEELKNIEVAQLTNHSLDFDIIKERQNGQDFSIFDFLNETKQEVIKYINLEESEKKNIPQVDKIILLKTISFLYSITNDKEKYPNKYDENFSLLAEKEANILYSELKSAKLENIKNASLMVEATVWYLSELKKDGKTLRLDLKNAIDDLFTFLPETITEKAYMAKAIIEGTRILEYKGYGIEILFNEMGNDYDWEKGYFKSQTIYSIDDVGIILGALNSLLLFQQEGVDNEIVNKLFNSVYESMIVNSGMKNLELFKNNNYNSFGIIPKFEGRIEFDTISSDWIKNTDEIEGKYNTNMIIWLYLDDLNMFPVLTKEEEILEEKNEKLNNL